MEKLIDSYELRLAAVEEENKKLKKRAEVKEKYYSTIAEGISKASNK